MVFFFAFYVTERGRSENSVHWYAVRLYVGYVVKKNGFPKRSSVCHTIFDPFSQHVWDVGAGLSKRSPTVPLRSVVVFTALFMSVNRNNPKKTVTDDRIVIVEGAKGNIYRFYVAHGLCC